MGQVGDIEVHVAVVVVVPEVGPDGVTEPDAAGLLDPVALDPGVGGHVGEGAVPLVPPEEVRVEPVVRHVDVQVTVVVVVGPHHPATAVGLAVQLDARPFRHVGEGPVPVVVVEEVICADAQLGVRVHRGGLVVGHVEVHETVVVVVAPGHALGGQPVPDLARLGAHLGEGAVPVVAPQPVALGCAPQVRVEVQVAVVVDVRPHPAVA